MPAAPAKPKVKISHLISVTGYLLLLALLLITTFQFPPPEGTPLAMVLSVKLLPLLILMPGLLKDSLRAHIWLCFVLLLYFTQSVLYVTQTNGHWLYALVCALTVIIFLSSMMHVHWSKQTAAANTR